jgi:hypothetical protein
MFLLSSRSSPPSLYINESVSSDAGVAYAPGMAIGLRTAATRVKWLLDPSDPLAPFNRRLALALVRRSPATVLQYTGLEGHTERSQARFVERLMQRRTGITEVAEIGFNAGHSTYLFLASRPNVRVVSFDLGEHDYVDFMKELIDTLFPGRHELVKGDSRQTLPAYADAHPERRFDLVFVDGGHDYEVAVADLANGARLGDRPLVMMDDMVPTSWGVGPVRAWSEAVERGEVEQLALMEDGFPLVEMGPDAVRPGVPAWALGRYRTAG